MTDHGTQAVSCVEIVENGTRFGAVKSRNRELSQIERVGSTG